MSKSEAEKAASENLLKNIISQNETYGFRYTCWNCSYTRFESIKKGVPKSSVNIICRNCGCGSKQLKQLLQGGEGE